ncbi:MAG TPA: SRPBCC domain-containing protein [Terracidiphilus sp.]|jgi:activator of HSP90 ATPase
MTIIHPNRRDVAVAAGSIVASPGFVIGASGNPAAESLMGEISHSNAAIHQEIVFAADVARVYRALTDAAEFDKVAQLSAAMNSGMTTALGTTPTQIDPTPGGAFSLFGGYVTGRMLELISNTRIVQAWRAGSWDEGLYSIARFALSQTGAGTKLTFDHTGFPDAAAVHLAEGWHINYWQPLAKWLS